MNYITKKNILWLIGALVIGALGNGLWEALLKPAMVWFGIFMLDLATLGLESLRDSIYEDVAKGSYERASLAWLFMVIAMLTGILVGIIYTLLATRSSRNNPNDRQFIMKSKLAMTAFFLTGIIIFNVSLFRINYTIRAANYAEQLIRITAPYLTAEERLMRQSQLAQLRSKEDYIRLVSELQKTVYANHLVMPEFSIY